MTDDWELDFNNPPKIPPPELVPEFIGNAQCDYCCKPIGKPLYVVRHIGRSTQQWAFCDNLCHSLFYMQHLRKCGL